MPYRRLPNTDKARLAALEKAVAMEHECDVDKQAASYKTLNEARVLLRRFKSAVEQFQYCYTAQAEANRQYQSHLKTARLYISHFIQVLNLAVLRNGSTFSFGENVSSRGNANGCRMEARLFITLRSRK